MDQLDRLHCALRSPRHTAEVLSGMANGVLAVKASVWTECPGLRVRRGIASVGGEAERVPAADRDREKRLAVQRSAHQPHDRHHSASRSRCACNQRTNESTPPARRTRPRTTSTSSGVNPLPAWLVRAAGVSAAASAPGPTNPAAVANPDGFGTGTFSPRSAPIPSGGPADGAFSFCSCRAMLISPVCARTRAGPPCGPAHPSSHCSKTAVEVGSESRHRLGVRPGAARGTTFALFTPVALPTVTKGTR